MFFGHPCVGCTFYLIPGCTRFLLQAGRVYPFSVIALLESFDYILSSNKKKLIRIKSRQCFINFIHPTLHCRISAHHEPCSLRSGVSTTQPDRANRQPTKMFSSKKYLYCHPPHPVFCFCSCIYNLHATHHTVSLVVMFLLYFSTSVLTLIPAYSPRLGSVFIKRV